MNSKLQYFPINWMNGMSIKANHFTDQHLAILDSIRDATALAITPNNYGLLGADSLSKYSENFRDNITSEKVEVPYCRAITQNGTRIEILNQQWKELNKPLAELIEEKNVDITTSKFWYILLVVDLFTRIPDGIEDEQESPRRKPHTRPLFRLELVPQKDLELDSLSNAMPIAKFENLSFGLRKIENYIPPCMRMNSHKRLIEKYEKYDSYLNQLKNSSKKIIDKIKHKRERSRNEQNLLADDIEALCLRYLDLYVDTYDHFRLRLKDAPPIEMMAFGARLARGLNSTIQTGNNQDHVIAYFHQRIKIGEENPRLNSIIKNTFEKEYYHYDIETSLNHLDNFLGTFNKIFTVLEQLEYEEFIPRRMVRRDTITPKPLDKSKSFSPQERRIKIKHSGQERNLGDELD